MPTKFDFISPGIQLNEVDESQIPSVVSDETGPVIVGRSLSGPAMKPVKIKSLQYFNEVFGLGISGKGSKENDIWRNGNSLGPTYAVYAAQAHLASQTTPVTFLRLLGEKSADATTDSEYAGWNIANSSNPSSTAANNKSAYGLFVIPSASAESNATGSLAAIFYLNGGEVNLKGVVAGVSAATTSSAGTLIKSVGSSANRFTVEIKKADGTVEVEKTFDFTPGSAKYIRNQFNTNPQLLQANKNFGLIDKNYFLGETFEEAIYSTSTTAGAQLGIILPLDSGSLNYGDHKKDMLPAKTGWFLNRKLAANSDGEKLFRLVSLHEGEWLQAGYQVAIKDLSLGNDIEPNSTFTIEIQDKHGNAIEQFSGLNLDPSSEKYVAKVIGDQYLVWDAVNAKYNVRGEYLNNSDYVYVEMASAVTSQQLEDANALPVGCYGPLRPKGFTLAVGSSGVNSFGDAVDTKTQATATLKIDDSRKIQTGDGAIISDGENTNAKGLFIGSKSSAGINGNSFVITFGAGIDGNIKGANGTGLASKAITFTLSSDADVSGASPAAGEVIISCVKNAAAADHNSKADLATAIAAVINGEQDNATLIGDRAYSAVVKMGATADGLLFTNTNGGDPDSVFIASVVNTDGIKLQLRGSQTADSGTNSANFGAYGGAWATSDTHVKLSSATTNLVKQIGDQDVTAGNATNATTITVTDGAGSPNVLTANASFFVDGNDSDATAVDNTVSNLATAIDGLTEFTATGDAVTHTVTITHVAAGSVGNSALLEFANGASGTFTNQGSANDASEAFTGGLDDTTDDFLNSSVLGNTNMPNHGGSSTVFAQLPEGFTGSIQFPSLRLTSQNANSNGKNFSKTDFFGVRHHRATATTRDESYVDLVRVLPSNATVNLTHHLGENESLPSSHEYSYVFSLSDLIQDSTNTNTYYYKSGSYNDGTAYCNETNQNRSIKDLLKNKVRQFRVPFFGGHDGLDLKEVEPFSNKNLTDKTRKSSYAYNSIFKALESIEDVETTKYNVLAIPGITNTDVTDEILRIAEDRKDHLAIIDIEGGYKPAYENNGSVTTGDINGTITALEGRKLNTSYAATYYPWVRLRDRIGGQNDVLYVPPSVAAIGALAKSEKDSDLWFAPAGFNRGGINELGGSQGPIITGTWEHLTKDDRDDLYQTNINPIARFPSMDQIVIFGQKTLQQADSALNRINVRRLLIYLKYKIGLIADTILFDQNVNTTWNRFKFQAERVLLDVQNRLGVTEFKLVLDDKTTTADLVDRNIMYAKIFIKPARSIEFIAVDFIISRSGVEF